MCYETDILSNFIGNLSEHITSVNQSYCKLIHKHNTRLQTEGEISFPLHVSAWKKHGHGSKKENFALYSQENLTNYSFCRKCFDDGCEEEICQHLLDVASIWPLKIAKCLVKQSRVKIFFDRPSTFQTVLWNILSDDPLFNVATKSKELCVKCEADINSDDIDLSQLRISYFIATLKNIATTIGYKIVDSSKSDETICLLLTMKNGNYYGVKTVICGAVLNSRNGSKETSTAALYLRRRNEETKVLYLNKHGDIVDKEMSLDKKLTSLADATVKIELLQVSLNQTVFVDIETNIGELGKKGGAFMLYNYARLASLINQVDHLVKEKSYPALIPLQEIDFSLLKKEEEWNLINYILEYRRMLILSVDGIEEGKVKLHMLCVFLSSLARCFSMFYSKIRVLTDPRDHLFPLICARIYLLKGVQRMMIHCFRLLDIEPLEEM